MKLRIGILGTRGIPNHYGGFEQITEYLSTGLAEKGHEVFVYNSHNHPYQKNTWKNVSIIHCYDPEYLLNTFGQFIYDLNCILDARKRKFDIVLIMGYSSSSIWKNFFPRNCTIIYNMDGLEWKRTKYSKPVKKFLRYAERLAVNYSHFQIADSRAIKEYIQKKYGVKCKYIPYGAETRHPEIKTILATYKLLPREYFMVMARMEPENNLETVLEGFHLSNSSKKMLVVGNSGNRYGRKLVRKYSGDRRISFIGSLFDKDVICTLRRNCCLYFHGHSVGGTNPSLLEAMADHALIAAHHNRFNESILQTDAFYFSTAKDITVLIHAGRPGKHDYMTENNFRKIEKEYNWPTIVEQYTDFVMDCYFKLNHEKIASHKRYAYE